MQSYHHFTLVERENLRLKYESGQSIRAIAGELKRSPSSISRELKRNGNQDGRYNAWRGCSLYLFRRKKSRRGYRLSHDRVLAEAICQGLERRWSPEIIAAKWNERHVDRPVSHSTIYKALKEKRLKTYNEKEHLRRSGKRKYCRGNNAAIHPERRIHDRPGIVAERGRSGDWEVDLLLGGRGKGCLISGLDRQSRYLVLHRLDRRSAAKTEEGLCQALKKQRVKTLTLDNGSEWANFKSIEKRLRAQIYFADPHSPWQRGSNENINGLLRWFFPKGCDFTTIEEDTIRRVEDSINNRPRKCLGWLTPMQVHNMCCT